MMKHAAQMRPKFEATLKVLKEELTGLWYRYMVRATRWLLYFI